MGLKLLVFIFIQISATGTANAMTTLKSGSIFTVAGNDLDSDTILYSMRTSPTTTSFAINQVTGEITATQDLKYELTSSFVFNVTASDSRTSTHALYTLTLTSKFVPTLTNELLKMFLQFFFFTFYLIFIVDINTKPTISSLVLNGVDNLYFPELTTAAGATLYTPTIYDPDTGQTQTVTINVYPAGQTDMFTVATGSTSLSSSSSSLF